jgi:outer membrane immunogenic protein
MNRMKRLLLASSALVVLGPVCAIAADLGVQPVYKAPAAVAPLSYDWRGFYVGAHVGAADAKIDSTTIDLATGLGTGTNSSSKTGAFGGGQIGYNFMVAPNWLLGIEADLSGTGTRSSVTEFVAGTTVNDAHRNDLFGTARGRVGYAAGNWLFYGTGGYAWSRETATRLQVAGTINAATPGTFESSTNTLGGWAAGAGIEWGITPNVSVKAEYLHYDFQNSRFVFPLANRRWEDNLNKDTVKIGVNWRLNWGTAP